jgi:hypothetical protein
MRMASRALETGEVGVSGLMTSPVLLVGVLDLGECQFQQLEWLSA